MQYEWDTVDALLKKTRSHYYMIQLQYYASSSSSMSCVQYLFSKLKLFDTKLGETSSGIFMSKVAKKLNASSNWLLLVSYCKSFFCAFLSTTFCYGCCWPNHRCCRARLSYIIYFVFYWVAAEVVQHFTIIMKCHI